VIGFIAQRFSNGSLFFQPLENLVGTFPRVGKNSARFSKVWKIEWVQAQPASRDWKNRPNSSEPWKKIRIKPTETVVYYAEPSKNHGFTKKAQYLVVLFDSPILFD